MKGKPWATDEVALLRACFARGDGDAWVAHITGRTVHAVALKRGRLGLTVRTITKSGIRDYTTGTLVDELRRRGFRIETPEPAALDPEFVDVPPPDTDASRWSVRGSTRVKGATKRGVTHTVHGDTPNAARRAWARAVRKAGGDPLLPSASVRLIEDAP